MKRSTSLLQVLLGLFVILVLALGAIFVMQKIPGVQNGAAPQFSDPNASDPNGNDPTAGDPGTPSRVPEITADITLGTPVSIKFKVNDPRLYTYHFQGKAGQKVRVTADRKSGTLAFGMYLSNLTETSTVDGYGGGVTEAASFTVVLPSDDTYKINISAGDDTGGPTPEGEITLLVETVVSGKN